jgi:hypothetical protein
MEYLVDNFHFTVAVVAILNVACWSALHTVFPIPTGVQVSVEEERAALPTPEYVDDGNHVLCF